MSQTAALAMNKPLQINDLFWTVQGEGRWSGRRALFVRMPYCNYDCPWCDTEYNSFQPWSEEDFSQFAQQEPSRFAVITGGEPMAHKDLPRVLKILKDLGFYIACETNGSLPIPAEIDFPTVSPKPYTQKKYPAYHIHEDNWLRAKEFKYVVEKDFDWKVLERHKPYQKDVTYSLSPEFNRMSESVSEILSYIQKNPQWRLNLQTHKWIQIP